MARPLARREALGSGLERCQLPQWQSARAVLVCVHRTIQQELRIYHCASVVTSSAALRHRCDEITECSPLHSYIMRLPLVLLATLQPAAALVVSRASRVAPLPAPLRRLVLRGGAAEGPEDMMARRCHPALDAHETGSITVGIHEVAYAIYGNPQGAPALFVHGGPGGGTVPNHARYFDPDHYRIILVDQRGCGKSTPFSFRPVEDNPTWDLT